MHTALLTSTVRAAVVADPGSWLILGMQAVSTDELRLHPVEVDTADDDRLLTDVVLLDLHAPGDGSADPMRALGRIVEVTRAPIVVRAGRGPALQYESEAMTSPQVVGSVDEALDAHGLTEVVRMAALRQSDPRLRTTAALAPAASIHRLLSTSQLAAAVADAVVVHDAVTWRQIAQSTGFSIRTVQAAPRRFAAVMAADAPRDRLVEPTQGALLRWLGRHDAYIRSWLTRRWR